MIINKVCLTFDINYIPYAKVLISSISRNLGISRHCDIFVLTGCDKLLQFDVVELGMFNNISLRIVDISRELADFRPSGRFPAQVYARFFMGKYLEGIVLYLDVDMIVNCCISEVFRDFDLRIGFGACLDTGILFNKFRSGKNNASDFTYFNAGMFICDLDNQTVLDYFREASYLAQQNNFPLADQDALNFSIKGRFQILPIRFNYTGVFYPEIHSIIHYAHIKPTLQLGRLSAFKIYNQYANFLGLSFPYKNYSFFELVKKLLFIIVSNIYYTLVMFRR